MNNQFDENAREKNENETDENVCECDCEKNDAAHERECECEENCDCESDCECDCECENTDKKDFKKEIFEWLETLGLAFAFVLVVFTFIFRIVTVDGKSMHYTLDHGDKLIISDMFYTPERGDIVVVSNDKTGVPIIKRVIATEGQTVDINFETWEVMVDGEVLAEDYINDQEKELGYMLNHAGSMVFPFTVSENCVFVLGDNRNHSSDSRYYGEFTRDEVMGRVLVRLLPIGDFGTIKPADSERISKIKAKN